jgi:hypothetical protein
VSRRTRNRRIQKSVAQALKKIRINSRVVKNSSVASIDESTSILTFNTSPVTSSTNQHHSHIPVANNISSESDREVNREESQLKINDNDDDVSVNLDSNSLNSNLGQWAITHNITHSAISSLLEVLKPYVNSRFSQNLPKHPRTLLKTPRSVQIISLGNGQFYHFGLTNHLLKVLKRGISDFTVPNVRTLHEHHNLLTLKVGIDGLPISKSSRLQFWPILASVDQDNLEEVAVVSLYYGSEKPPDIFRYLAPFVDEMLLLAREGVTVLGTNYSVRIRCLIADAPARSFIKNTKNHNAYFGCERCYRRGSWRKRVVYPVKPKADEYTDETFVNRCYESHHVSEIPTPLESLDFGMITQIPLEYMHLCCLGVMKKFLILWAEGPLPHKISNKQQKIISDRLVMFSKRLPTEFFRKCRSLKELRHWKATEFRTFMLYVGPEALKGVLRNEKFEHFLLYHTAMYILISNCSGKDEWINFAENLLCRFVEDIPRLYSKELLVYNVHSLLHLCEDVRIHGSLDNFSAFSFENFMSKLKRNIRTNSNHLSQVVRRLMEANSFSSLESNLSRQTKWKMSVSSRDSCFMTDDGRFCLLTTVSPSLKCKYFRILGNVKYYPVDSTKLGIFNVKIVDQEEETVQQVRLVKKCILLPSSDDLYVCIPLCNV